MSEFEALVLMDLLADCYAWRDLHDPHLAARLDVDGILALARRAGCSETVAQKIGLAHAWVRMKHDVSA